MSVIMSMIADDGGSNDDDDEEDEDDDDDDDDNMYGVWKSESDRMGYEDVLYLHESYIGG